MINAVKLMFFLVLLLPGGGILRSQTSGEGAVRKPKIDKVNVFGETPADERHDTVINRVATGAFWAVKCNPVVLFRGEVPVYLERRLSRIFSLEAALGMTFEDFFKTSVVQGKPLFPKDPNVNYLSGFTGKLSFRYFPRGGALSGLYISPEIDFKNYRKDVSGVYLGSDARYASGKLRDQQNYMDLKALVGFQKTDEISHDFYFDWYLGAGLRAGYEDNVVADEKNANVIKVNHSDVLSPLITLGVKIGLGF